VKEEVENSLRAMDIMKKQGIKVKAIEAEELHMLVHSYYSCIFEVVLHNMSSQEAKSHVQTIVDFFTAGWKTIFSGIN